MLCIDLIFFIYLNNLLFFPHSLLNLYFVNHQICRFFYFLYTWYLPPILISITLYYITRAYQPPFQKDETHLTCADAHFEHGSICYFGKHRQIKR